MSRRIRLDAVTRATPCWIVAKPTSAADDSQRHRLVKAVGAADGHHEVGWFQEVAITQRGGLQVSGQGTFDLQ